MPDEAPNYRELLDAAGYPPIRGGSPEGDEPGTDQPNPATPAPDPSDQATEVPGTPAADQFPDDLDLSAVPEDPAEARKWVAQRHTQMQGAMTRATQAAAESRREAEEVLQALSDPELAPQILDRLGYEVGTDPNAQSPEQLDPEDALAARLDQVEGLLSQQQEQEYDSALEAAEKDFVSDRIKEIEAREGREFSEPEKNLISSFGRANRLEDGEPNLEDGYKLVLEHEKVARERYLDSKRAARKPGAGVPASRSVDPANEDEDLAQMAERYDALVAANQADNA